MSRRLGSSAPAPLDLPAPAPVGGPRAGGLPPRGDDLDGEIGVTATDESDQLEDSTVRPLQEQESHSRMPPRMGSGIKVQFRVARWHSRHRQACKGRPDKIVGDRCCNRPRSPGPGADRTVAFLAFGIADYSHRFVSRSANKAPELRFLGLRSLCEPFDMSGRSGGVMYRIGSTSPTG
jgi:hypothetical protein